MILTAEAGNSDTAEDMIALKKKSVVYLKFQFGGAPHIFFFSKTGNPTFVPSGSSGRGRRRCSLELVNGPGAGGEWRGGSPEVGRA